MRHFTRLLAVSGVVTASILVAFSESPASSAQSGPIQHVIIIMEENHTFDNYFGAFPGANGVIEAPASNPAPHDLGHSGQRAAAAIDGGADG